MIKISSRLKAIADFVNENDMIADIGCDHALLDIFIVKKFKNIKIIATDIHKGAIQNAKENITKIGSDVKEKIELRLGDGLDIINKDEVNTLIIAGMGALTIISILFNNKSKLNGIDKIIIQSNSDVPEIRHNICKLGYYIADEDLIKDKQILYNIIVFKKGKKKYTYRELLLGPVLSQKGTKLYNEFINNNIKKNRAILDLIPNKYSIKRHLHQKDLKIFIQEQSKIKSLYN